MAIFRPPSSKASVPAIVLFSLLACGPCTANLQRLTDDLTQAQRENHVPAMALVLFDQGKAKLVATWGDRVTADTPFRWGSITKTFTALALLRLVEDGKITLHQRVRELVEPGSFINPWQRTHPVRVEQLLELTAGFGDLSALEFNHNQPLTLRQALDLNPGSRRALWPPGLQHSYSNSTPGITALVVETVSQRRFEDFMRDEVLRPMGMTDASLEPVDGLPGGFQKDGITPIPNWHMTFGAFGALNASAAEMAQFLGVLLNRGQRNPERTPDTHPVFTQATLDRLYRARTGLAGQAGLPVSYGAGSYGWVSHGHVFYGHGGDADGYRSRYGVLPIAGRGYAIVINVDNIRVLRLMRRRVEAFLTHDLSPPNLSPPTAATPDDDSDLARYAGVYYPSATRFGVERWRAGRAPRARIAATADGLTFTHEGRVTSLKPLGNGHFRRPDDPVASVVFARDAEGSLYLQGQLGNFFNLNSSACPGFISVCGTQSSTNP